MEDIQRSQSISTENQTIAKQAAFDPEQGALESGKDGPPLLVGQSSLVRVAMLAKAKPQMVFTSLAHRIDLTLLRRSFKQLRKNEWCKTNRHDPIREQHDVLSSK